MVMAIAQGPGLGSSLDPLCRVKCASPPSAAPLPRFGYKGLPAEARICRIRREGPAKARYRRPKMRKIWGPCVSPASRVHFAFNRIELFAHLQCCHQQEQGNDCVPRVLPLPCSCVHAEG